LQAKPWVGILLRQKGVQDTYDGGTEESRCCFVQVCPTKVGQACLLWL